MLRAKSGVCYLKIEFPEFYFAVSASKAMCNVSGFSGIDTLSTEMERRTRVRNSVAHYVFLTRVFSGVNFEPNMIALAMIIHMRSI